MKKLLFISNICKKITNFHITSLEAASRLGYEFHFVANFDGMDQKIREKYKNIFFHHIDIVRFPFSKGNIKAFRQLCQLMEDNEYDVIHCNTPIGGALGRICGAKYNIDKVIYTAHGFHFYKGAPKLNWIIYYSLEKWLARYTDAIITINQEDYELAKSKFKLKNNGKVYYVPGVGIDLSFFDCIKKSRIEKRIELGIPQEAFVMLSVGELNKNKNNRVIISAMERIDRKDIHYVLCGVGELRETLQKHADELGVGNNIHFLGYRNDVNEIYGMADCFVMPSLREGLPRSLMEAMACGLPCVVSRIRGNVDLIKDEEGGFLCDVKDVYLYAKKISLLVDDCDLREKMRKNNLLEIQKFDTKIVEEKVCEIYAAEFEK